MQKRRGTFLAVGGVILFLIFFGVAYSRVTAKEVKPSAKPAAAQAKNNECGGCHEMQPEIATWMVSSHSRVPCTACHQVKPENYKAKHDSKSFSNPIQLEDGIPNSVCEQCHAITNREVTPSGDLIIPHDKHGANGVACIKCHSGVVHARISERGVTASGDLSNFDAWDTDTAKKVMTKYFREPSMWTCINCHRAAGVTRKCSACHTAIPSLPSHDQPIWKSQHGKFARANIDECSRCHVTPGSPKFASPSTGDIAADFARAQEFCYNCHLKRPAMHENSMIQVHPVKAAERGGTQNCLTCHNRDQAQAGAHVTATYCNQCHWMQKPVQNPAAVK